MTARSKTWTIFARLNTGIVGSNPTRGMDVCVRLFVFVLFCVKVTVLRWPDPLQGVLPTVYRIKEMKNRPRSKGL
jgi:hypothetical protein